MRDHFGVGLAAEHITLGLQFGTQLIVVLNDAVVHQSHTARFAIDAVFIAGAGAEVGVCVVHGRGTVGGPACVCNAGTTFHVVGFNLRHQLRHTRGTACALEAALAAV